MMSWSDFDDELRAQAENWVICVVTIENVMSLNQLDDDFHDTGMELRRQCDEFGHLH